MARYESVLETVGKTPVIRLNRMAPEGVQLYVKAEAFNPMGSVKDRLALGVIEDAERRGELSPGQTVVEATSGNTGLGLAMVCAAKGYPLVVVMAENFSLERRKMLRFLGARVVLTPAAQKGSGMLQKAVELAEANGWYLCRQFENEANAEAHARTTAPEILADFEGERLDYWVTGYGTGGTLNGVARVLKEQRPETKVAVCEPDNVPILASGIPQPKDGDGAFAGSHPMFRPHLVQGWSGDFIPSLAEDVVEAGNIDRFLPVPGRRALEVSRDLARKEGIFTGISGGATVAGALALCEDLPAGSVVLAMLPDTGERYLTTPLFEDIAVDMTEEELELSRSTPTARFDAPPPKPPSRPEEEKAVEASEETRGFVEEGVTDAAQPVVMFAMEWCEFCWSVRKMFARAKIPYRSVDLDSVEFQEGNRGGMIRAALKERTGWVTIPLIFIGGEFLGGATDAFDSFKEGKLQEKLKGAGVEYDESFAGDPYQFLPGWLHPR
jgi:cysteine synthase A